MWIAPRDMCALMATTKAKKLVRTKLSGVLSLSTSSPEILFAMTNFHKFYVKYYNACIEANKLRIDRHELVKVPALVFHILHSLGFCTYINENGLEQVVRDKNGIPICGDFWNAFRTAHSRTTTFSNPLHVANPFAAPVVIPARIIETFFTSAKILSVSKNFKELNSRLHALRPTRFAKYTFAAKRIHYPLQSHIWEGTFEFWEKVLRPLDQALSAIEKIPSENNLKAVQNGYTTLMWYEDEDYLKNVLDDLKGLKYQESGDKRDQHAVKWKRDFQTYLEDLIVFVKGLKITLHKIMQGDVEMTALPRRTHGTPNASVGEAPTRNIHNTPESRMEESSPSSASTETESEKEVPSPASTTEKPTVPIKIGWENELCFQRHAARKSECERDEACYYRQSDVLRAVGTCRDKQPQMMRESSPEVYGVIADPEKKTKPPVNMPHSFYALKQEKPSPETRKERRLSQKESEKEKKLASPILTLKKSKQRKTTRDKEITAVDRAKSPVLKKQRQRVYCNYPKEVCDTTMDCFWDGEQCKSQSIITEDIRAEKTRHLSFPRSAQHFTISS